jgi:hypothetical protein
LFIIIKYYLSVQGHFEDSAVSLFQYWLNAKGIFYCGCQTSGQFVKTSLMTIGDLYHVFIFNHNFPPNKILNVLIIVSNLDTVYQLCDSYFYLISYLPDLLK